MVCYNCANVIPRDSEYCPCCRIKLYEVCPKCGHRYSSQYKICNKCGTDREEYLAEQRRWEQCRLEEARRKEAEHKKVLEEERRRERQRIEEERQRQLEAKRREEERKKEEAEFIRRIESTDAYKEAYKWLIDTIAIISEKANTEKVDRQNFRSQFWGYLVMCKKLVASVDRFDKVVPLTEFLGEDNLSGKPLLVRFVNRSLDVISF